MDDLDDMIDEFEKEYYQSNSNSSKTKIKSSSRKDNSMSVDIEKEIDDILNDDIPISKGRTFINGNSTCNNKKHSTNTKDVQQGAPLNDWVRHTSQSSKQDFSNSWECNPVYLGGTSMVLGQNTARNKCKLRCTSCDFKVEIFNNYSWNKSVDYLFLRNNMPDFQRLKAKLVTSQGCRSYSCQCSWKSVSVPTLTSKLKNLHWVCGCH